MAGLIENSLMADPIKDCTDVNLLNSSLLPISPTHFAVYGPTQKRTTGTKTFPISKLDGWKHITAFHKSSETFEHPREHWCNMDLYELSAKEKS